MIGFLEGFVKLGAIFLRRLGQAAVGNRYDLLRLQQAAILHDRGQRKPWEHAGNRNEKYHNEDSDDLEHNQDDEGIPEEVAEAWVTYQRQQQVPAARQGLWRRRRS